MSSLDSLNYTLMGAIAMGCLVIGAFFMRFWQQGRDRFFLLFACSFFVEGVNRIVQSLSESPNEGSLTRYGIRLLAFTLILAAIFDKNRSRAGR